MSDMEYDSDDSGNLRNLFERQTRPPNSDSEIWIMIWLNALAHHLHTTALSFTVFWAQAEISGSASKDCFFESHQAMICLVPHSFYKISSPCLVYTKFFGEFVPYDKWLTLLDIPKKKKHRVSKYFYTYSICILDDVNYNMQINTLRFVFIEIMFLYSFPTYLGSRVLIGVIQ